MSNERGTVRITTEGGELLHEGLEHRDLYALRVPPRARVYCLSADFDFGAYCVEQPMTPADYSEFLRSISLLAPR